MVGTTISDTIHRITQLLEKQYGKLKHIPTRAPLDVLIKTILSQNTSDVNSDNAFASLVNSFKSWDLLVDAEIGEIAYPIRSGGLGEIKAQRIRQALREIARERGELNLDFLADMPVIEAESWLTRLPGVGLKTARCVLLFALGMPAFPVDTHIFRISKRLGLTPPKASLEEAHRLLGGEVPPGDVYNFHVLLIEHGRKVCRARNPVCGNCVLGELCPHAGL